MVFRCLRGDTKKRELKHATDVFLGCCSRIESIAEAWSRSEDLAWYLSRKHPDHVVKHDGVTNEVVVELHLRTICVSMTFAGTKSTFIVSEPK